MSRQQTSFKRGWHRGDMLQVFLQRSSRPPDPKTAMRSSSILSTTGQEGNVPVFTDYMAKIGLMPASCIGNVEAQVFPWEP